MYRSYRKRRGVSEAENLQVPYSGRMRMVIVKDKGGEGLKYREGKKLNRMLPGTIFSFFTHVKNLNFVPENYLET